MKRLSCVLATVATIAVENPIVAQDKPMMQDKPMQEGMEKPKMHGHVHHHYHHHYHHHMAKPPMTDKM